jgi:hypothetical protein
MALDGDESGDVSDEEVLVCPPVCVCRPDPHQDVLDLDESGVIEEGEGAVQADSFDKIYARIPDALKVSVMAGGDFSFFSVGPLVCALMWSIHLSVLSISSSTFSLS